MIKQTAIFRISLIISAAILFWVAYLVGLNLAIPAFLLLLYLYLEYARVKVPALYLVFLFVLNFYLSYSILSRDWSVFYLPFTLVPVLSTIIFASPEVSFVLTLASAIAVPALIGNPFHLVVLLLSSGIISSILVLGARRRMEVIRAGLISGIIQILILFFINRFQLTNPARYLLLLGNSLITSVIVLGVLPLFEYLFRTVTNISLLELADFNQPLLQRMIMEAPGTYHHSLMVGNLSDAACRAVGANALLARIGAYYHDIGKIEKAEYFSENQTLQDSKHDHLSADMSKMVIMHHVREGVELAKKYKLNGRLIDFVQQHHGTALVYYFYRRALEAPQEDRQVREEPFRYPGPKPSSKETAIVLLADSVEAATRALKDPEPAKIEQMVHKVVNNKFIDGQLDECDLTLKDLEKICEVFIHILSGIYHSRVSYPETTLKSDSRKKPAKKSPSQPERDTESNP
jgi:putative nucleotidyltransferase with HDIG domain